MLARLCLLHALVLNSNKDPSPIEPVEDQPEEDQGHGSDQHRSKGFVRKAIDQPSEVPFESRMCRLLHGPAHYVGDD